jgi:hypothetical protein
MAETPYTYSIAADTSNAVVAGYELKQEIGSSSIVIAVERVNTTGDVLTVVMKDSISSGDKTTLDSVVLSHQGVPVVPTNTEAGYPIIHLDAPSQPDGRIVVVNSPSNEGWLTWFTGYGDDVVGQKRGEGQQITVSAAGTGTEMVDLEFIEPIEVHDGELSWSPSNWDRDDRFSFSAIMPATVVTPNIGLGNCNLVPTGLGYNLIVPAAGDGTHDVDLTKPQPVVPASGGGYWEADYSTGLVSPSATPGASEWHLLDVEIESFFIKRVCFSNPLGVFSIDVYKAEWVSNAWKLRLTVDRTSNSAGQLSGWLMCFREKAT